MTYHQSSTRDHVPALVVILQAMETARAELAAVQHHDGAAPSTDHAIAELDRALAELREKVA